ncbi:PstS family phosphate ABC transporter substrate-binding protein [Streptomyces beijiangensis]|uniref:Substrate-binding domain-containing protein n=1 Tax=Streptomyces beijiangensis TaxID=163361 RepID=A0A939JFZ7_9ACTN|nr:substrate-binding domain-containing protein [Streptomyces beijiangensis]MBO0510560.1 substrate-binding domain-containing protein [Streptomyces beijiangensis]
MSTELSQALWAVIATVLASACTGLWQYYRLRHRIAYRIQLNIPISIVRDGPGGAVRLRPPGTGPSDGSPGESASLVLLRIENVGFQELRSEDIEHELYVRFPGRTLIHVEPVEVERDVLLDTLRRPPGLHATGERLPIPRFAMKRKDHFKLLLLLDGPHSGDIRLNGHIGGGDIVRGHARVERAKAFRNSALLLTLGLGFLAGYVTAPRASDTSSCPTGALTVIGSTAFKPVLDRAVKSYRSACPRSAQIKVELDGSAAGTRSVTTSARIAFSDTRLPGNESGLTGAPVAVTVFRVVVNRSTKIENLTLPQLRDLYAGRIRNWSALGGADLPVRLVGRNGDSGSRQIFESKILANHPEPPTTSGDCRTADRDLATPTIRCERPTTDELLAAVDTTPGALGYADAGAAASTSRRNTLTVSLGRVTPTLAAVKSGRYPYWSIEYAYTRGRPPAGSPAAAFLDHLAGPHGETAITAAGNYPCEPQARGLCG